MPTREVKAQIKPLPQMIGKIVGLQYTDGRVGDATHSVLTVIGRCHHLAVPVSSIILSVDTCVLGVSLCPGILLYNSSWQT